MATRQEIYNYIHTYMKNNWEDPIDGTAFDFFVMDFLEEMKEKYKLNENIIREDSTELIKRKGKKDVS